MTAGLFTFHYFRLITSKFLISSMRQDAELSFSSTQLFVSSSYVACVLLEIGRDKLGHVDCDRNLTP